MGIKRQIPASEITKVIMKDAGNAKHSYKVYSDNKKLFTVDELAYNNETFHTWMQENNIKIEHKKGNK